MKSVSTLKAMIIDQSSLDAAELSKGIKEIFQEVHVVTVPDQLTKEFLEVKPHVLFINLMLVQRGANFDLLERIPAIIKKDVVILGYTEAPAPDLMAHAIERGIHDVIVKPYRPELITPKIKQSVQSQLAAKIDAQIVRLKKPIPAKVQFTMRLSGVDENGFTFTHEHYISKGTKFPVEHALIAEIFGASSIELMITKTWTEPNAVEFRSYAEPIEQSDVASAALRRFILKKHEHHTQK